MRYILTGTFLALLAIANTMPTGNESAKALTLETRALGPYSKGATNNSKGSGTRKDPEAPKRPLTAYMFFANDQRDKVREAHPDVTFGQLSTVIAANWNNLPPEQRQPYEAKAAADKKRYDEEMAAYQAAHA